MGKPRRFKNINFRRGRDDCAGTGALWQGRGYLLLRDGAQATNAASGRGGEKTGPAAESRVALRGGEKVLHLLEKIHWVKILHQDLTEIP